MSDVETLLRVLIVDDDPLALSLAERHLSKAGYEVVRAADGTEAIDKLREQDLPLVITDWVMPGVDGIELCRAIRANDGIDFAYIIVMTAQDGQAHKAVSAFESGADDFISKPYRPNDLIARVRAGERIVRLHQTLEHRNRQLHRVNAEMAVTYEQLDQANNRLSKMVVTDDLTGLFNRREAMTRLNAQWSAAERNGRPLSCIAIDIDRFKRFNDEHGHAVGDVVLREVASLLKSRTRREESVCRLGGEEFLVICPQAPCAQAMAAAERLRRAVEAHIISTAGKTLRTTISLGVAERTASMHGFDDLIREADRALYAAKHAGRNTVRSADSREDLPAAVPVEAPSPSPTQTRPSVGTTGRVLVVDDDALSRAICRKALAPAGYDVLEAVDGNAALVQLQSSIPDVIILDMEMPVMDGLSCLRRIKADPPTRGIPVIIASGRGETDDIVAGLESGADEYLTKPITPRELVTRVRTMIRLRRELQCSNEVRGEQSRALGILADYSRRLAAADGLDAILELILTAAAELTCSHRLSILLPDATGERLGMARSIGPQNPEGPALDVPMGASTVGRVFAAKLPLNLVSADDVRTHCDPADALLFTVVPSVAIPLCAPESVVGVLVVSGRRGAGIFRPLDLEYLELIGNLGASSIADHIGREQRDNAHDSIVVGLAKLAEHRDSDTGRHLDRVTRFSVLLAQFLRLRTEHRDAVTDEFLADLERAVPLHDIGKVAVPDHILQKPGRLTDEEMTVMQTHAVVGARTIRSLVERIPGTRFLVMAEQIAHGHHERFDGRGYPRGVQGDAIPLAARIAAVADVYDALTTRRVYKEAFPHDRAVTIILEASGTQFDPVIVDAFLSCEREFHRLAMELADEVNSPTLSPTTPTPAMPVPA